MFDGQPTPSPQPHSCYFAETPPIEATPSASALALTLKSSTERAGRRRRSGEPAVPVRTLPERRARKLEQKNEEKKEEKGRYSAALQEAYAEFVAEEEAEGSEVPWTIDDFYEQVWKRAGFK